MYRRLVGGHTLCSTAHPPPHMYSIEIHILEIYCRYPVTKVYSKGVAAKRDVYKTIDNKKKVLVIEKLC